MAGETVPQGETAALEIMAPHALELITSAEINQQIATAKRFPRRELSQIKKRMLDFATLDEETAESCFYTLRRQDAGGDSKVIQGPSVRLAEIAVACYGNLRAASRIIDNDGHAITSQGVCMDLENNVCISVEVRRRITNKSGRTYSDDMQIVTGNAANSIAFRNAVLKVIPGALVGPVYEAAKKVAVGDATTLSAKREKIVKRFNSMGVELARVLAAVGRETLEAVGLEDLENLIGIGTAIKGGDTSIEEAFPYPQKPGVAKTGTEGLKDKLKAQQEQQRAEAEQAPGPAGQNAPASATAAPPAAPAPAAPESPAPPPTPQPAQQESQDDQPQPKSGPAPDLFEDRPPAGPVPAPRPRKTYESGVDLPDAFDTKPGTEAYLDEKGIRKLVRVVEEPGEAPTWKTIESTPVEQAPQAGPQAVPPAEAKQTGKARGFDFRKGGGK